MPFIGMFIYTYFFMWVETIFFPLSMKFFIDDNKKFSLCRHMYSIS